MCNRLSFVMKPARGGTPRKFFYHKKAFSHPHEHLDTKSHTTILQSHGFRGRQHDAFVRWELRPHGQNNQPLNAVLKCPTKRLDLHLDAPVPAKYPSNADFAAARAYGISLISKIKATANRPPRLKTFYNRQLSAGTICFELSLESILDGSEGVVYIRLYATSAILWVMPVLDRLRRKRKALARVLCEYNFTNGGTSNDFQQRNPGSSMVRFFTRVIVASGGSLKDPNVRKFLAALKKKGIE